jgi:two-component sensor histidine kinase
LKEIHHRVKNNLQIVSSLLNLQTDSIHDETFQNLILESRNRINSMALVHEMLYSSKDLRKIEISEYIPRLAKSILNSVADPNSNIEFAFEIQPKLLFEIDQMIPLGLILNEIISNSIKYAFPSKSGIINISLEKSGKTHTLNVSDNGIGLPQNFKLDEHASLGIQLIYMLSEQLDGVVKILGDNGTSYQIKFYFNP